MKRNTFKTKENASGGQFPAYSKPHVIGYFSLDCDRKYCGDLSQLNYIHLPVDCNVKFDLDRGRTLAQKKDDSCDEKIDNLLRWMLQNSNGGDWYVLKPYFRRVYCIWYDELAGILLIHRNVPE
jgi:hypothetical protein